MLNLPATFKLSLIKTPQILIGFSAMLALSACATQTTNGVPVTESAFYPAGYTDGCQSSTEAGKSFSTKIVRDGSSFESDAGYRAGWRQGYQSCTQQSTNDGGAVLGQQETIF